MRFLITFCIICFFFVQTGWAAGAKVAVFPVSGVNTDRSFTEAFGTLLAKKYEAISKLITLKPSQSGKVLGVDSNYTDAAKSLGVSEYIVIDAVGLYLSRREEREYRDSAGTRIVVAVVNRTGDDDDDDDDDNENQTDQNLLDNSKTIVTAVRYDAEGNQIHKVELTLLTYGDIEESCDRFANALYKKISVEEAMSATNITRREGMGHNQLFVYKAKGVKFGAFYPVELKYRYGSLLAIGFDMKMESKKFFIEFGGGGRIPTGLNDSTARSYGGGYMEMGFDYLFSTWPVCVYSGIGLVPSFNFGGGNLQIGIAPYGQAGVMLPQALRVRFFVDIRAAMNALPLATGSKYISSSVIPYHSGYPLELGVQTGICF